jgi:putative transcriptional regulator
MKISYKPLWKLLIDRGMKKKDLRDSANICQSTMSKLAHDENVTTDILVKICNALSCNIGDIVEVTNTSINNS